MKNLITLSQGTCNERETVFVLNYTNNRKGYLRVNHEHGERKFLKQRLIEHLTDLMEQKIAFGWDELDRIVADYMSREVHSI